MNSIVTRSTVETGSRPVSLLAWQHEIESLYNIYYLIDSLLGQSLRLPAETTDRYRNLQWLLMKTVEQFLAEMDEQTELDKSQPTTMELLRKHITIMKRLNAYANMVLS
ncbi:hypothetical protein HNV11_11690 [Spirosoma taeanense]|uniref:Uncharacterized protein n=1 Tax=Spirosoma taeanense TaxID=2735870 RepID=A0A6M5Y6E2_9BACT|nr:hypothetical protein [Spirosoma taeanense]QJW89988.1 hypothetical protein HNV11_11690 [Spirosoma taeanense]